jgi:hypothetical protein
MALLQLMEEMPPIKRLAVVLEGESNSTSSTGLILIGMET